MTSSISTAAASCRSSLVWSLNSFLRSLLTLGRLPMSDWEARLGLSVQAVVARSLTEPFLGEAGCGSALPCRPIRSRAAAHGQHKHTLLWLASSATGSGAPRMWRALSEWKRPVSTLPAVIHMLAMCRFHLAWRTRETGTRAAPGVCGPAARGLTLAVRWMKVLPLLRGRRLDITRFLSSSLFMVSSRISAFLKRCRACTDRLWWSCCASQHQCSCV